MIWHIVYTCQIFSPDKCNFFLWGEDAKPREAAALLSNSRQERAMPPTPNQTPPSVAKTALVVAEETKKTSRRLASLNLNGSTTELDWPSDIPSDTGISSDDDSDAGPPSPSPVTRVRVEPASQSSSSRTTTITITTASKTKRRPVPPSSSNVTARNPSSQDSSIHDRFSTPLSKIRTPNFTYGANYPTPPTTTSALKTVTFDTNAAAVTPAPKIPTPTLFQTTPTTPRQTGPPLIEELLSLLAGHNVAIPTAAKLAIVDVCDRYEAQKRGIMKGRDVSRVAVKEREKTIGELQYRVESLEIEREALRRLRRDNV